MAMQNRTNAAEIRRSTLITYHEMSGCATFFPHMLSWAFCLIVSGLPYDSRCVMIASRLLNNKNNEIEQQIETSVTTRRDQP